MVSNRRPILPHRCSRSMPAMPSFYRERREIMKDTGKRPLPMEPSLDPVTHVFADAKKGHIERVIRDYGKGELKAALKYNKAQGLLGLHRIVLSPNPGPFGTVRVVPPSEEESDF